jgi:periplasmic divalent cation tolerance protein
MLEHNPDIRIVLTTAGSHDAAVRMGRTLVEERLAACATAVPGAESVYCWRGELQTDSETLLLLKTDVLQLDALYNRLVALHTYETPEFLVLAVDAASSAYREWLNASLMGV